MNDLSEYRNNAPWRYELDEMDDGDRAYNYEQHHGRCSYCGRLLVDCEAAPCEAKGEIEWHPAMPDADAYREWRQAIYGF